MGDAAALRTYLQNNPGLNLDVCDDDGSTLLHEVVTKTAQFLEVTRILVLAGASIHICDNLGNTPLHNAILYYPSTEESIQLLLDSGAITSARNLRNVTPVQMADDHFLRLVLKDQAKPQLGGGGRQQERRSLCSTPALGDTETTDVRVVCSTTPHPGTPSILKKRRRQSSSPSDSTTSSSGKGRQQRLAAAAKRIKFAASDSVGACVDPAFSDDDDDGDDDVGGGVNGGGDNKVSADATVMTSKKSMAVIGKTEDEEAAEGDTNPDAADVNY